MAGVNTTQQPRIILILEKVIFLHPVDFLKKYVFSLTNHLLNLC